MLDKSLRTALQEEHPLILSYCLLLVRIEAKNTTVIFLRADFVLFSDRLTLCGSEESTKTYSVLSALTYHFLYSLILIFLTIDNTEVWFRYNPQGMKLLLPVVVACIRCVRSLLGSHSEKQGREAKLC